MTESINASISAASGLTLADIFRRSAILFADRVALLSPAGAWTYRALDARTDRLASALADRGIGRGGRVAILSTTRTEYIEVYLAVAKLGATAIGLNFRLHDSELAACLAATGPRTLFVSPSEVGRAAEILGNVHPAPDVICFGEAYESLLDKAPSRRRFEDPQPEDIHSIIFTSGTTGKPKAAMISQRAAALRAYRVAQWFALTPEDGMIGWLPLFHTGIETVTATLLSGGKWATFERIDMEEIGQAIEEHRLSWTFLPPVVIEQFISLARSGMRDLSSIRFAFGYANMVPDQVQEFTRVFGSDYWDAYGQTETSFLLAMGRIRTGDQPDYRKSPTPFIDMRIVDEAMEDVAIGTAGECVVRGPTLMSGYLDNPDANKEAFRGGWLHTGDVLIHHEDGSMSFVDRVKYLIKTAGENVYPAEVENVLARHEAVREACVIGVPDERWGEAIKAFIVLAPGASLTAAEASTWCRRELASFKAPRLVEFLAADELPRSITGKVQREELRKRPLGGAQRIEDIASGEPN